MMESQRNRIVQYATEHSVMIEKNALELLETRLDWQTIIDQAHSQGLFVVSARDVQNTHTEMKSNGENNSGERLGEINSTNAVPMETETLLPSKVESSLEKTVTVTDGVRTRFRPMAKEYNGKFRILEDWDVTLQCKSQGKVNDFLEYFQQKFLETETLLKKRTHFKPKPIKSLRTISKNNEIEFVGMVSEKWKTKNGHTAFQVEDLEEKCIALILKDDAKLQKEKELILLDDVFGLKGIKLSDDLIIIKELYWPDVSLRKEKTATVDLSIAGVSDIHTGSRLFLEDSFQKFLDWLNGKNARSEQELEEVGKIKYIVLTGDNVDGIGVYPSQYDELAIKDIFKQYEVFEQFMEQIPEYVEVFLLPGNHDAVRNADPQPALSNKLIPTLAQYKNVHLVSSPAWVEIEGLKTLAYHGGSLHDLFAKVSNLSFADPAKGMVELLKKRTLMASYGEHRPYVPEKKDFMAIHDEPDLIYLGEHHRKSYAFYRGTTIINNSTFQARTSYQIRLGHIPTPGIIPVLNMKTRKIKEYNFYEGEETA